MALDNDRAVSETERCAWSSNLQPAEGTLGTGTSGAFPVVVRLGSHLRDFADTAAVVDELDLVIMTDTAVAHLAGPLGGLARQTGLESP